MTSMVPPALAALVACGRTRDRDRRDGGLVQDHLAARGGGIERSRVEDAALRERDPVANRVEAVDGPGRQVVDDRHVVAPGEQAVDQVMTDEAGPTGHENLHDDLRLDRTRTPDLGPRTDRSAMVHDPGPEHSRSSIMAALGRVGGHPADLRTMADRACQWDQGANRMCGIAGLLAPPGDPAERHATAIRMATT